MGDQDMKDSIDAATAASAAQNQEAAKSAGPLESGAGAAGGPMDSNAALATTNSSTTPSPAMQVLNAGKIIAHDAERDTRSLFHRALEEALALVGKAHHFEQEELKRMANFLEAAARRIF